MSALVKPEIDIENDKEKKTNYKMTKKRKRITVIMNALIITVMMTHQRIFHPQKN